MARVPYEIVSIEADKILEKILSSSDADQMSKYYDEYLDYLHATGWSEEDFDLETSRRVDLGWEESRPKIPKSQLN